MIDPDAIIDPPGAEPLSTLKNYPLRRIAEAELSRHLGDLDDKVRSELAVSLVRQWLTNEGHAAVVLPTHQCWFQMVPREGGGVEVGFGVGEGKSWASFLAEDWGVDEEEIPEVLHQLNVCQTAVCHTTDGQALRVRIDPKERALSRQEEPAEED